MRGGKGIRRRVAPIFLKQKIGAYFKNERKSGPSAPPSPNLLSHDLASRIIQASRVDRIAGAVESIAVTSFANGADRSLRAIRTAVSKDQRLLEAERSGWPVACAGECLGLHW